MTDIILADFNIRNENTNGHYIERAIKLAELVKASSKRVYLLCPANKNIKLNNSINKYFDGIYLEVGFDTFFNPVTNAASGFDKSLLTIFKEVTFKNDLIINFNQIEENFFDYKFFNLLNDKIFFENFSSNIEHYYCALPDETIALISFLLTASGIEPGGVKNRSIEKLSELWFRVKKESNAYVNFFSQRILDKYSKNNTNLMFITSNISEVLSGLSFADSKKEQLGTISYLLHQPKEFNENNSYHLRTLHSRLSESGKSKISINVASGEFKKYLSSKRFNYVGEIMGQIIGPFMTLSDDEDQSLPNKKLSPHIVLSHYVKKNGVPKWLINPDKSNFSFAKEFRRSYQISESSGEFTNKINFLFHKNALTFTYLGDIRDEKKFDEYADLVINCWNNSFDVYAIHPTFFSNGLVMTSQDSFNILKSHSKYNTFGVPYKEHLSRLTYQKLIRNSSLIFNCYDPLEYAFKQSGVFYEAMLNSKMTIINSNTSAAIYWNNLIYKYSNEFYEKRLIGEYSYDVESINTFEILNESSSYYIFEFELSEKLDTDTVASLSYTIFKNDSSSIHEHASISSQKDSTGASIVFFPEKGNYKIKISQDINESKKNIKKSPNILKVFELKSRKKDISAIYNFERFAFEFTYSIFSTDMKIKSFILEKIKKSNDVGPDSFFLNYHREEFIKFTSDSISKLIN